jgi:hypothetical protein
MGELALTSAEALLGRLERIKQTGPGQWVARCPAHDDRSPSLSIREVDDGKVLIRCFAGCGAISVLDSLGLEWSALFPKGGHRDAPPSRSTIPARDLLVILDHELTVVVMILQEIITTRKVGPGHFDRLIKAVGRIAKARVIANPAKAPLQ